LKHRGKEEAEEKLCRAFCADKHGAKNSRVSRAFAAASFLACMVAGYRAPSPSASSGSGLQKNLITRLPFAPFPLFLCVSKILVFDCNNAVVSPAMLNRNLHITLFGKPLKLFSPFNQQNASGIHQIV
jgi:hypothetical protein